MEENEQEDDVQVMGLATKRRRLYFHRVSPSRLTHSSSRKRQDARMNERLSETVKTRLLEKISSNQLNAETEGYEASALPVEPFVSDASSVQAAAFEVPSLACTSTCSLEAVFPHEPSDFCECHSHDARLLCPNLDVLERQILSTDQSFVVERYRTTPAELWLMVHSSEQVSVASSGPLHTPTINLCCDGVKVTHTMQVFHHTLSSGPINSNMLSSLLSQLVPQSGYKVCPGIRNYPPEIRFQTKHLRDWGQPFYRLDSDTCLLWHIPNNSCQLPTSHLYNVCKPCKTLYHDIQVLAKRASSTADETKALRTSVSSNYGLKYLSPESHKQRISRNIQERKQLMVKNKVDVAYDCELNDKQHAEMLQVVRELNRNSRAIDDLCEEGERVLGSDDNLLRAAWHQDVVERLEYERDQAKSVEGGRGNRWSQITLRMALAVYTRSPAAYDSLKSFKLLQLPHVRTLKHYIDSNLEKAGEVEKRLVDKKSEYMKLVSLHRERLAAKKARRQESTNVVVDCEEVVLPIGEGSLVLDEVKVGMKLLWSSRDQKFVGHAMSGEEMSTLCDVYRTLSPDFRQRKTTYVLQTLWRDLSSNFDVIGPHYTSEGTMDHKFLIACLLDAMFKFHKFGFKTVAVVCDGASPNMSMIKLLSGSEPGAYKYNETGDNDQFAVRPWFLSPYTGHNVYFIICPSHQLKSMVAALYQSRQGGTRSFTRQGVKFGWSTIQDMYHREVQRKSCSQCSRVPKLKTNHVYRDAWTRLNVLPSKIMQQDEVLAELQEYASSQPKPHDAQSVEIVVKYLRALNNFFERGLLGNKVRVFDAEGRTLQRMEEGFGFFREWIKEQISEGAYDNTVDSKHCIAWQTWDLLRILWYGFKGLVSDFLSRNPGHHINPRRLNGSAVETIFSQLKYVTSGQLTAATYATAKASLLTKQSVCGTRPKDDYRDTELYIRESRLRRKK